MTSNMYGYSNNHYGPSHGGEITSSQLIILDNECQDCGKQFTNVSNLNRHVRKIHKREPNPLPQPVARLTVNCPVCTHQFCTRKELDGHLQFDHDISVSLVRVEFDNMDDFGAWKRGIERETVSYYAVERTVVNVKSKKTMYGCHRSGTFTSQRKRERATDNTDVGKVKTKGSIKMGAVCPSRMAVHQTPDKIYVDFVSTHVGHGRDAVTPGQTSGRKKNAARGNTTTAASASVDVTGDRSDNNDAAPAAQIPPSAGRDESTIAASSSGSGGAKRIRRPRTNKIGGVAGATTASSRPKVNKALLTKRRGDVIAKLSSLITFVRDCTSHAQLDVILRHLEPVKPALEALEPSVSKSATTTMITSVSNTTTATTMVTSVNNTAMTVAPSANQHVPSVGHAPLVGGYGTQCSNVAMYSQQLQHHHQLPHHQQHNQQTAIS